MNESTDIQEVYKLVEHIEEELHVVRRLLEQLQPAGEVPSPEPRHRFSLYGIFPPSNATWEDFQAAKRSWRKDMTDI